MANRMIGNIYIIDSLMGAGVDIQGANTASWLQHQMKVKAFALWCANTTAEIEFVYKADTTATAARLGAGTSPTPIAGGLAHLYVGGVNFEELRVKTLTAGTGFIYFE